jgi:hypothetical protein
LQRQRYVQYLDQVRGSVRAAEAAQRRASQWRHPGPDELVTVTGDPARRWERRRDDDDFLWLRAGTGEVPADLGLRLKLGDNPLTAYDQTCLVEARRLVTDRASVPVSLSRPRCGRRGCRRRRDDGGGSGEQWRPGRRGRFGDQDQDIAAAEPGEVLRPVRKADRAAGAAR